MTRRDRNYKIYNTISTSECDYRTRHRLQNLFKREIAFVRCAIGIELSKNSVNAEQKTYLRSVDDKCESENAAKVVRNRVSQLLSLGLGTRN